MQNLAEDNMDDFKRSLPELRYIYYHLNDQERVNYIRSASSDLIDSINEVILNLLFSHKNGLKLTKSQMKTLRPYKAVMKKFILSKSLSIKRNLLKKAALRAILATIIAFASKANIEN